MKGRTMFQEELKKASGAEEYYQSLGNELDTLEMVTKAIEDGRPDWEIAAFLDLTPEDWVALIRCLLKESVLWDTYEVANYLQVGKRRVQELMRRGLPYIPLGPDNRLVRFIPSKVKAWIINQEVNPL